MSSDYWGDGMDIRSQLRDVVLELARLCTELNSEVALRRHMEDKCLEAEATIARVRAWAATNRYTYEWGMIQDEFFDALSD